MLQELTQLYKRDLTRLIQEIENYEAETLLWVKNQPNTEGVNNSAGNLCLHIIGNLNHFIGTILGKTGYVRQRELEFSLKNVPKSEMIQSLHATISMIEKCLSEMKESDLTENYPIEVLGHPMTTGFFLVHLQGHLNYHLGQINYHRRLLKNSLQLIMCS